MRGGSREEIWVKKRRYERLGNPRKISLGDLERIFKGAQSSIKKKKEKRNKVPKVPAHH